jgi:hypothetical protein
MIKVYLDDERETPDGWTRVYTVDECLRLLQTRTVSHVSLDNDLGLDQPEGYTALDTLEEWVYCDPTFPIPVITIHSANPARSQSMRQTAAKLEWLRQQMEKDEDEAPSN